MGLRVIFLDLIFFFPPSQISAELQDVFPIVPDAQWCVGAQLPRGDALLSTLENLGLERLLEARSVHMGWRNVCSELLPPYPGMGRGTRKRVLCLPGPHPMKMACDSPAGCNPHASVGLFGVCVLMHFLSTGCLS
ncbi:ribosomal L1 domain-containing protein 1 [Platysternon megacephalum]|uniref:Ribosomal L1 domain-containing protein 1 n=1 Tax=Platysternon megacephalum TaxID=55544 RepID=A0A4D9EDV5_9SAUR|nr:ribosomal L1 domain-containing protein 1 [Platysternon megacephalum]